MNNPKIGDILYSLNVGNMAMHTEQKLTPVTVTKVGRKYFTCTSRYGEETAYNLSDWSEKETEYIANTLLYKTKQEWEDEKEMAKICKHLYEAFEYGNNNLKIPLEKLRDIFEITNN